MRHTFVIEEEKNVTITLFNPLPCKILSFLELYNQKGFLQAKQMSKNKSIFLWLCALVLTITGLSSCSSDDDILSPEEKSVVGYWQLVGVFHYDHQEPLTDIEVVEYRADGTMICYKNGQQTSQMRYLLRAEEGSNNVFDYRCGGSPNFDEVTTESSSLTIDEDMLITRYYGCFSQTTCFYRRISNLNDVDHDVSSLLYEDRPTTLEGTWHMVQVCTDFGIDYINAGNIMVHFYADHTMKVENHHLIFLPSGTYSYEVVETNEYPGGKETKINIVGQQSCTYRFFESMLVLDYGMAYDGPGYFFRKLKSTEI